MRSIGEPSTKKISSLTLPRHGRRRVLRRHERHAERHQYPARCGAKGRTLDRGVGQSEIWGQPENAAICIQTLKIPRLFCLGELCVSAGDAYLLCSDGFWEYVLEKDMEKALKNADTPQQWLDDMLKKLRKRSPENCDNRSAVCVMVK